MHTHAQRLPSHIEGAPDTGGLVMNLGWRYDAMVFVIDRVVFGGGLSGLQRRAIELADIHPGDNVLDVGCGTGSVAMLAKERVGKSGRVVGIDPGPRQIDRARRRAARRGAAVEFEVGVIERLTTPDQSFDAVLSTMMMHHLPIELKRRGFAEVARVLKPGGRFAIADFRASAKREGERAKFGADESDFDDIPPLLTAAGLTVIETGDIGLRRIPGVRGGGFIVARRRN